MTNTEKRITFLTQLEVNYTPSHTGNEPCSACRWYGGEGFCNIVEDYPADIVSNGHCDRYEPVLVPGITIERDALAESEETYESRDFHGQEDLQTWGYIAPASNETGWLKTIKDKLQNKEVDSGATIWQGQDGQRLMLIITSNGYKDRENETIATDALKHYVDSCWKGEGIFHSDNPLLFWHDDRVKMGDIIYADMFGTFLVEVAREDPTPLAKALWNHAETVKQTGASHRFGYFPSDRDGEGTFYRIRKQETSWLPREDAANLLTYTGVLPMSDKRRDYFNKIVGMEDAADLLDKDLNKLMDALAQRGITHKSTDESKSTATADNRDKGWAILLNDFIGDLAEKATTIETLQDQIESLQDSREKALSERDTRISALEKTVKALQEQLDARPRSASRASETEIDKESITEDIRKTMTKRDPIFGVEVYEDGVGGD